MELMIDVVLNELTGDQAGSFNRTFAERVGCGMSGLKECLMKKSVSDILTAQENITGNEFLPVVDDNFLHGEFTENKK